MKETSAETLAHHVAVLFRKLGLVCNNSKDDDQ